MSGDFIDEFHKGVLDWADSMSLEGDEREDYIAFHMEKAGYKRATTWTPPEPEEGKEGGASMFSRRKGGPGRQGGQGGARQGGQGGARGQYFRQGG